MNYISRSVLFIVHLFCRYLAFASFVGLAGACWIASALLRLFKILNYSR